MTGTREDWFPTSIWYFDVPDLAGVHHDRWIAELYRLREEDDEGVTDRSTRLGWHSDVDLDQNPLFAPLIERILEAAGEITAFEKWDLERGSISMINAWGIINPTHGYNALHNHPASYLSGVYYLRIPEDSGDIVFRDPREARMMEAIPYRESFAWTYKNVKYRPRESRMLIFPSWLLHEVLPNQSAEDRICVSFNLGYRWK